MVPVYLVGAITSTVRTVCRMGVGYWFGCELGHSTCLKWYQLGKASTMDSLVSTGWDLIESLYFENREHVAPLLLSFLVASITIGVQGKEREREVGGLTYIKHFLEI